MKILMATMGLDIGGAETHIVELSKALCRQGHDVAVVSHGGVYVPEITAAGIRHYEAPLHRRSPGDMARARAALRDVIRREKPDVVHAHARIPAFLCGSLQKSMGFPFVTTCHGVYAAGGALRLLSNWGERTLAVSDDVADYLTGQYGIPAEHITLTVNGIDTGRFAPAPASGDAAAELGIPAGVPVVGHVSRIDEASTLTTRCLIAAAPRLARAVPGVRLLLVGGGDVFDRLKALANEANGAIGYPCVLMPGPRTDIDRLLGLCRIFVGVSRAALEAMACGKPVILSGSQGHMGLLRPDNLEEAIASNLCCRGSALPTEDRVLADVLEALALPEAERSALGTFGRQVVLDTYSVDRMAADALSVYRQVRRRKSVVLSGYYGFRNLGDDAILEAVAGRIRGAEDRPLDLTVLSNAPEETEAAYGVHAVYRFAPLAVYRAIRRCDYFVSGGGSLLQDKTSAQSLLYYISLIRAAELHRKPVMIFANGIGPVDRPLGRRMVRRVLDRADLITLREASSLTELRSMGVRNPRIHVTADPVFLIEAVEEPAARALLAKSGVPAEGGPLIGVSLRPVRGLEHTVPALAAFCDAIARAHGARLVFLDMQDPQDAAFSRQVEAGMSAPACHFSTRSAPEMMGVIRCMDAVVSMRLHTLIFSAKQRVPLLGIVYDPKVSAYLEALGMPSAGSADSFVPERAAAAFDGLMADLPGYRARLERVVPALETAAAENWTLFGRLLEGEEG